MFPISDADVKAKRFPFVNIALIAASAGVFLYSLAIGADARFLFFYRYGLIPDWLVHGVGPVQIGPHQFITPSQIGVSVAPWVTMFTSMFIHGSWLHIIGNMLFLWVFGDNVEDKLGHFWYLVFYLAAGVGAGWLQVAVGPSSQDPTIGASGAIAGVLGAYLLLYPYSRINTAIVVFFVFVIRIPAVVLLGFWFVLQFISGVGSLGPSSQGQGVAYWTHIGGFALGMLAVLLYKAVTGERLWPGGRRHTSPPDRMIPPAE